MCKDWQRAKRNDSIGSTAKHVSGVLQATRRWKNMHLIWYLTKWIQHLVITSRLYLSNATKQISSLITDPDFHPSCNSLPHNDDHNAFEKPQTIAWRRMSMQEARSHCRIFYCDMQAAEGTTNCLSFGPALYLKSRDSSSTTISPRMEQRDRNSVDSASSGTCTGLGQENLADL